ncbi:MAG: hypothetical protein FJ119_03345 [Deltaproteobacteria bacterium]|nr:hypothetical protein [Deltaproteobacteria bacterium]
MGKVIVPRPNEKELAAFALAGLTMKASMTEDEFIAMAVAYLNSHNVLHLATCKHNEPRCTPLEYFNNGLIVHVFSEGGGKIANLKENELVSYSIADPYDPATDFFGASGMQVWGRATFFKKNTDLERFKQIRQYSRYMKQLEEQGLGDAAASYNFNVITIEPCKIRRLCYRQGMRNVIWKEK